MLVACSVVAADADDDNELNFGDGKERKILGSFSAFQGVHHYLVISFDLTQLSLHIKPCGCRRTFPKEGIWVQAGRDCQVVPGKHGPLRFQMILECHRALTGMPPFVVAMKEGRYGL